MANNKIHKKLAFGFAKVKDRLGGLSDEELEKDAIYKSLNVNGGTGHLMKPKPSKKKRRNNPKKKKEVALEPIIKLETAISIPVEERQEKPVNYRFIYAILILIILILEEILK